MFTALYSLERSGDVTAGEIASFRASEAWLNEHLAVPDRLTRTRRKGAEAKAITWLKADAAEPIRRLRVLARFLNSKGVQTEEIFSSRPGYIVYEDEYQIAAEPFADTVA